MIADEIITKLQARAEAAYSKHGDSSPIGTVSEWTKATILLEELGEIAHEVLEGNPEKTLYELYDLAAATMLWIMFLEKP